MMPNLDGVGLMKAVRGRCTYPPSRSSCSRHARARKIESRAWKPAPTTISSSHSAPESSLPAWAAHLQINRMRRESEDRERRLAMEAATANAQFRAFFEQGALFAGIMHIDGTIIEPNRLSLEACGYRREQVVGKPFWDCPWWNPSPALVEQIREASAQAARGETFRTETPYFVADGTERMVDLIILPVKDASGQVMSLAPTGTDITDRKRAEDALKDANRRKDEFLATLARAPKPARSAPQWLADHPPFGRRPRGRRPSSCHDGAQLGQLVHLVDDLLDLSRISLGLIVLRKDHVDLEEVVQQAVETNRPLMDSLAHTLRIELPPERIFVDADNTRLAQVISNLLNNAAKYPERGGHIVVSVERQGNDAVVNVRDTGLGIPAHMLPRVFDIFTQVDQSLERSQGGLGIGLSLVGGLDRAARRKRRGSERRSRHWKRIPRSPARGLPSRPGDSNSEWRSALARERPAAQFLSWTTTGMPR